MRNDALMDNRQVICPHASTVGYSKRKCKVGDLVLFNDQGTIRQGRMIARIVSAPLMAGETVRIVNWLCLAVCSVRFSSFSERWVCPTDVTEVYTVTKAMRAHMACFLSVELGRVCKRSVNEVRQMANQQWSTLKTYQEWKANV